MKFRKKPVVVEAIQWQVAGDHPQVEHYPEEALKHSISQFCELCSMPLWAHGWIKTLEGGHIVCPNDWIIKGVKGEFYPCKPDIFEQTYETVEVPNTPAKLLALTDAYYKAAGYVKLAADQTLPLCPPGVASSADAQIVMGEAMLKGDSTGVWRKVELEGK